MSGAPWKIVVIGLTISSAWGNGHATTYRALLRGLGAHGHEVLFLECDMPWYAAHRDLPAPQFCDIAFYSDIDDLRHRFARAIAAADHVIVGSYVPDGIGVIDFMLQHARGTRSFYDIDTPVTLAALERRECAYLAPRQIPALDLYLSFSGGPVLHRLEKRFGARRPRALYCCVDETHHRPRKRKEVWDLGYVGTYSADRQPALERLLIEPASRLPDRRFVVAGPQYPPEVIWPPNVERIEYLPPAEHATFYSRQRFTLNITRADMAKLGWSPSVRLFEAGACGTPIISDDWPGLSELLPVPAAIVRAAAADDVVAAMTSMPELARRQMAETARTIVLESHTGEARARVLESYLAEAAAAVDAQFAYAILPRAIAAARCIENGDVS